MKEARISYLLSTGSSCHVRCFTCTKDFRISGLEAIASYGGLMKFSEVQAAMRARCPTEDCQFRIGPGQAFTPVDRAKQESAQTAAKKTPR